MAVKLVLYRNDSALSKEAKAFLVKHQLEFEEVDVTEPNGTVRLRKRTQQTRVPAFEMKKSHSVHVVAGFDNFSIGVLTKELGLKETAIQKTLETS